MYLYQFSFYPPMQDQVARNPAAIDMFIIGKRNRKVSFPFFLLVKKENELVKLSYLSSQQLYTCSSQYFLGYKVLFVISRWGSPCLFFTFCLQKKNGGAEGMARRLRVLAFLLEVLSSLPSDHMVARNHLQWGLMSSSGIKLSMQIEHSYT